MNIGGMCVLEDDKLCTECGECEICDLDRTRLCDNCGKCLDIRDDAVIKIDKIVIDNSEE